MGMFSYEAINRQTGDIVSGETKAETEQEALSKLKQKQNLLLLNLKDKQQKKQNYISGSSHLLIKNKSDNLILFTKQLANLLQAEIKLGEALKVVKRLLKPGQFQEIVEQVHSSLNSGQSFSDSLAQFPDYFSLNYINMIKVGEEGGFLALTCQRLANNLQDNKQLKSFIISSLIYPVILLLASIAAVIIMLTYVLPNFTTIYDNYGHEVPKATDFLLSISQFLVNYWFVILLVFGLSLILFIFYYQTAQGKRKLETILLKVPVAGDLLTAIIITRLCRALGSMLENGVPLLKALNITESMVGNSIFQTALREVSQQVKQGSYLADALDQATVFPAVMVYMIGVGEQTGSLGLILLQIADNFAEESKDTLERLMKIFEPCLILAMGLIIAFIIVAMLLPILRINIMQF